MVVGALRKRAPSINSFAQAVRRGGHQQQLDNKITKKRVTPFGMTL